ncbi:MAG: glycosyltransferase [Gammaproteobacteria bacterium]|nr:glycosyltransferase [Gammaproteobacteria bacterium]
MMPRLVVVVQNLMGVGHQRRAGAICAAAAAAGWGVTLISGGYPLRGFTPSNYGFVQLPPARCPDLEFDRLIDEHGREVDEGWREQRKNALLDAVARSKPDVLLLETFPFGRKLLRFELIPLLNALSQWRPRPVIASSIRDIIEYREKRRRYDEMAAYVNKYFDLVLVHSDRTLVPLEATFPPYPTIAAKVRYTGYVYEGEFPTGWGPASGGEGVSEDADEGGCGEVIVSAGGGGYGRHLLHAAVKAHPLSGLARRRWRILVGDNVADGDFAALKSAAEHPLTVVQRVRPDFPQLLKRAHLSISQGGYNTVLDVLQSAVPALIVAYHDRSEREQLLRARILAQAGYVSLLPNGDLTARSLATAAVHAAAFTPRPHRIQVGGAERTVDFLAEVLAGGAGR